MSTTTMQAVTRALTHPGLYDQHKHTLRAVAAVVDLIGPDAIPAALAEPAARFLEMADRAAAPAEPATYTPDDLAAADWRKRLDKAAALAAANGERARLLRDVVNAAHAEFGTTCAAAIPALWETFDAYWAERVDYLAAAGTEPSHETGNEIRARDEEWAAFQRAHRAMLDLTGSNQGRRDYRARFWTLHTWTREQWQTLIDSTGPALAISGNTTEVQMAQRIGATPRLARTYGQPWREFVAFEEGRESAAWDAHYAAEQAGRGPNPWDDARAAVKGHVTTL